MKKNYLSLLFILLTSTLWAQQIQWAYKVLEFSSQKKSKEYSATQILGLPNSLPLGMENTNAWEPTTSSNEEFIKVGFLYPAKAKQIIITESFHPGSLKKVFLYDAAGKEYEVASYIPKAATVAGRYLSINTSAISFAIFAVKIVVQTNKNSPVGIDAIGLSDSELPYKPKVNSLDLIKASMVVKKLDTTVNSIYPEMGPLISPDGKTLYFSRRDDPADLGGKKDLEDIWYSNWNSSTKSWDKAKNIGFPLNNKDPNFINSISPDGNTILLGNSYLIDGGMEDGVSISSKTTTGWSDPIRLIIENDATNISKMANYFMSNSQKILLLSNDRKGDSYGDRDIYVSFLKADSTWTKPLNLGKKLNTKATEAAPFLASDDKTLYFTSDGLNGYGGSDIYVSRRLDESWTNWSTPENLGPIVNSSHDESFLSLPASGNKIYFTSQEDDKNNVDIYYLELPPSLQPAPVMIISGHVYDTKTQAFIADAKIVFENLALELEVGIAKSNPIDGQFQIILPAGANYGYLAEKKGYVSVHSNINLTKLKNYKEFHNDIFLTPIEAEQVITLNNVFFDFDSYTLKKESYSELNRIVYLLKSNATLSIEVAANTDSIGTAAYNDKLSIQRAESVTNYLLLKSGIGKDRILLKHYGESKPVATNATKKGRQLNRRVHFTIIHK